MDSCKLLKQIVSIPCLSGFEPSSKLPEKIRFLLRKFRPRLDSLGNVTAKINSGKPKILVEAHLDEVGFFKAADKIYPLGDIDLCMFDMRDFELKNNLLYFKRKFKIRDNILKSPALDNRVGCVALLMLPKIVEDIKADITLAFTSKEETTQEGILKIVRGIKPDILISIDSAYAKPFLNNNRKYNIPILGKGPAIQKVGKNFKTEDIEQLLKIASINKLKTQFEIIDPEIGQTNLSRLKRFNFKKVQINIPVRYQHSKNSEVNLKDIEETTMFLAQVIRYYSETLINNQNLNKSRKEEGKKETK